MEILICCGAGKSITRIIETICYDESYSYGVYSIHITDNQDILEIAKIAKTNIEYFNEQQEDCELMGFITLCEDILYIVKINKTDKTKWQLILCPFEDG